MNRDRSSEAGGVIYWIFIAIALFAALSFTISKIGRTGGTEMGELAQLRAADIMQYAGAVQRGIRIMRINGIDETAICFHAPQWGHNDYDDSSDDNDCGTEANLVFHPAGGAISFQLPDADWYDPFATVANDGGDWVFSSYFEVEDVGTNSAGADTEAANADLVMATAPLKPEICEAINRLLNLPAAPIGVATGTYDALATAPFNTNNESFVSHTNGRIAQPGRERCVTDGAIHMYYKVILAR